MIHHLHGRLVEKHPTHVVVECGGVGYFVAISLTTFDQLGDHELVKIHTHMVVREDAQLLYGFATAEERSLFLLLLGVNGVGANTARLILSAMDPATASLADFVGRRGRHETGERHRGQNRPADHRRFAGQGGCGRRFHPLGVRNFCSRAQYNQGGCVGGFDIARF